MSESQEELKLPETTNLVEAHCVRCNKIFFPTPEHIYKDYRGRYCSWTCFNHRNDGKVPRYKQVECLYPGTDEVVKTFQSATKAAEWVGTCVQLIDKSCREGTERKGYLWRYKE